MSAPQPTAELMMAAEEAEYADEAVMMDAEEAPMMAEEYAAAGEALIEADGATMMMDASRKSSAMHEIEMVVEDLDRACEYVGDLVEEYEGTADEQRYEADGAPCANLYIELPAGNAGDFLRAAAHYDKSGEDVSALSFDGDGDVSLLLVLRSE